MTYVRVFKPSPRFGVKRGQKKPEIEGVDLKNYGGKVSWRELKQIKQALKWNKEFYIWIKVIV